MKLTEERMKELGMKPFPKWILWLCEQKDHNVVHHAEISLSWVDFNIVISISNILYLQVSRNMQGQWSTATQIGRRRTTYWPQKRK